MGIRNTVKKEDTDSYNLSCNLAFDLMIILVQIRGNYYLVFVVDIYHRRAS